MFFDDKYSKMALATLKSIFVNKRATTTLKLYTSRTFDKNVEKVILSFGDIEIYYLDNINDYSTHYYQKKKKINTSFPPIVFNRIFAPFFINEEKIVYLDSDVIFVSPIEELYETDIENKSVGASVGGALFNSGIMIIDLIKIKHNYTINDFFSIIDDYNNYLRYPDQDLLNIIFAKDVKIISDYFNYRGWNRIIGKKPVKECKIIHYLGEVKPDDYRYVNYPMKNIFWKYAKQYYSKRYRYFMNFKSYFYYFYAIFRRIVFYFFVE